MKTKWLIVLSLFLLCTSLMLADVVVLGNGTWKPYLSLDFKEGGFASHVVTEAFKEMGIDVEYEWFGDAWKRAYVEAENDTIDGTLGWSYKAEREKIFFYSQNAVIPGSPTLLYFLKSNPIAWDGTIKSLEGKTIGGHIGYTYGELIDKAIASNELKVQMIPNDVNNFKKLLLGRIDGVILDKGVTEEIIAANFSTEEAEQITYAEIPIRNITYHLLLNRIDPKNEERMKLFDEGFDRLRETGKLAMMLEQFENGWYESE